MERERIYDPDEECYRHNQNGQDRHARTGGRCIRSWCGAIGAIAVGAMAIGRLRILEARVEKLSIGTLTVDHLNVRSR